MSHSRTHLFTKCFYWHPIDKARKINCCSMETTFLCVSLQPASKPNGLTLSVTISWQLKLLLLFKKRQFGLTNRTTYHYSDQSETQEPSANVTGISLVASADFRPSNVRVSKAVRGYLETTKCAKKSGFINRSFSHPCLFLRCEIKRDIFLLSIFKINTVALIHIQWKRIKQEHLLCKASRSYLHTNNSLYNKRIVNSEHRVYKSAVRPTLTCASHLVAE